MPKPLIFFLFSGLVFFFKKQCLGLPAFNDEWNYIHSILAVYDNHLNPFVSYWAYHPPVFFIFTGLLFKFFGCSLTVGRAAIMLFSALALYFTFLLGEILYDKKTGFFAGLLLFFSPFFFAQCGLLYCDMLVTALSTATIYYFISGKKIGYLTAATLLVLTKEPAILIIIAIGAYEATLGLPGIIEKSDRKEIQTMAKKLILKILFILSPLLFFLIWVISNRFLLGWFFYPAFALLIENFSLSPNLMQWIIRSTFWYDFRFFYALAIILAVLLSLFKKSIRKAFLKKEFILFAILALISIFFFSGLHGRLYGFSMRYVLFLQPLFFLAGTAAVIQLIQNKIAHTLIFIFSFFIFINCWHSKGLPQKDDSNLDYMNIVRVHKETADFLAKNFSTNSIIAAVPINFNLTEPVLGYVETPLLKVMDKMPESSVASKTILVISRYYRNWIPQAQEIIKFQRRTNPTLVKKFTQGDEEISVYSVP